MTQVISNDASQASLNVSAVQGTTALDPAAAEAFAAQTDIDADRCEHCSAMGVRWAGAYRDSWLCDDHAERADFRCYGSDGWQ